MTILVTGANGFVGRHVVARLAGRGRGVRAMVRNAAAYSAVPGVEVVEADLTRPETLGAALEAIDVVVHCAALTANLKPPYPGAYDIINRGGTENLAAAASAAGVQRIVVMSGLGTKPAPVDTYMATRWSMEEVVRNSGIPYVLIQPSVQFGDGAEFVNALARLTKASPVVPLLGGGGLRFQPIWVEDVVTCIEKAIDDEKLTGQAVAIGGSEYATFREIIDTICAALGKRRLKAPLPLWIARLQAPLMALLPHPPLTKASLELFGFENTTEIDAVDRNFGFHPRGFREHLAANGVEP
jgi:NADH dehydrogenase